ncbi:NlpC/P60 family protein [Corynebacterium genitalium ATCC 33030]|uniref:NlpC/P60 family protein n=1 Tax=Corynebacterium genitalium ATCC 33030 TaxID=585529 RepID=D7WAJ6_9CORY|nr:NlpC/P60 family protein [Corynebacterium genitalium]EFK54877.1 NlpC/P60 family protein [Corynebacterium genitalium ATCC 33030]UUA89829.1 NlpC/P60 family protein [Corynebacterium genitalium ATCC 33030]
MTQLLNELLSPTRTAPWASQIEQGIHAIMQAVPEPLPHMSFPATPDFTSVTPLAEIVGADPSTINNAATALTADRETIDAAVREAVPHVATASADIVMIGQRFLTDAAPFALGAMFPLTAPMAIGRMAGLVGEALVDVVKRVEQLEQDLAPLTERLDTVVARALERPPLVAPPEAQAAEQELRELADAPETAPAAASAEVPPPPAGDTAPPDGESEGGSAAGRAAVEAAKSQMGTPYVWGGSQPGGFDCSGLTSWAYKQAGVEIPRTAENQAVGQQVSYEELQPGDLVVWSGHVAMYAGDGMMVEAGDPVQMNPVRTENIGMPFKGFWRPTA